MKVYDKQKGVDERIDHLIGKHNILDQWLQHLRNLPGSHRKPLSRAEWEFKAELGK